MICGDIVNLPVKAGLRSITREDGTIFSNQHVSGIDPASNKWAPEEVFFLSLIVSIHQVKVTEGGKLPSYLIYHDIECVTAYEFIRQWQNLIWD